MKVRALMSGLCLAALLPCPAFGEEPTTVNALRQEIQDLSEEYKVEQKRIGNVLSLMEQACDQREKISLKLDKLSLLLEEKQKALTEAAKTDAAQVEKDKAAKVEAAKAAKEAKKNPKAEEAK